MSIHAPRDDAANAYGGRTLCRQGAARCCDDDGQLRVSRAIAPCDTAATDIAINRASDQASGFKPPDGPAATRVWCVEVLDRNGVENTQGGARYACRNRFVGAVRVKHVETFVRSVWRVGIAKNGVGPGLCCVLRYVWQYAPIPTPGQDAGRDSFM